ncbi:MAG TPA: tetratricopeptide repeat protein [Thermoanaerobaculia bacterium]|nr:tetratricopeptide repeat protein [Thermoanaerobaculia bacterium]
MNPSLRHSTLPLSLAILLLGVGCFTTKPRSLPVSSSAKVIPNVPVRTWGDNSCGAAALSTVLNRWGDPVTEDELMSKLQKGKFGGVVTVDLLIEARQRGYAARLIRGDEAFVKDAVSAGKPVVLMLKILDAPGGGVDLFHYIVVDGHDPARNLVRTQFGDGNTRWTSLAKLEKSWKGGGHAALLVEPGSTADVAISKQGALRQAVGLEDTGKLVEAVTAYKALIDNTPQSVIPLTNLGNVYGKLGRAGDAEAAYRQAITLDPNHRDALNNLAWLLMERGEHADAESFAQRAVDQGGPDAQLVLDTLARIQARRGNCSAALATFDRALSLAPAGEGRSSIEVARSEAQKQCPVAHR